nr:hypothetical protein [Campylobacter coli]
MAYDANLIEKRWQEIWDKNEYFEPKDDLTLPKKIYFIYVSLSKWSYTYGTCEKL